MLKRGIDMDIEDYKRYGSLGIFLIITVLAFFIIKPFLVVIITAGILAYVFHPLFLRLKKKVKKESLAALIICVLIILAIIIPAIILVKTLAAQAIGAYSLSSNYISNANIDLEIFKKIGININPEDIILSAARFFADGSKAFLTSIPNKLINFFLMIFMLYYFLKESESLPILLEKIIPLKKQIKQKILSETKDITHAVVYGSLMTALIQGIIGAIGFAIFGIPSPLFWGLLMALFALIPILGTAIIWFPAALILIGNGIINNQNLLIGKGIGLIIYGVLLISLIDNFIKPKIIESKAKMHPAIILLGIIGGISFFGVIGILLGPLILAVFITLIKIYGEEYGV